MLNLSLLEKVFNFYKKNKIAILLLLVLFSGGIFFSSIIPPFQSPDEQAHLKRAYLLSKGRIAMETPAGESTGGEIDTGLNSYMGAFNYIAFNTNSKVTSDVQKEAASIRWSGVEKFGSSPAINYYLPVIYLPQTLGLLIGRLSDLTIAQSYYLARYLALLSSLLIIFWAFSISRINAFAIAILFMPLMVFQMVSTSQDGFAMALLLLTISCFLKLTNANGSYSRTYFILMCTTILVLATSRINLLPLLVLPFTVIYLTNQGKKELLCSLLVALLSVGWILYALATTVDNRVAIGASTEEIIFHYLKNPFDFISVIYATLINEQLFKFYVGSFVGVLGWLDTTIDNTAISIIVLALVAIFMASFSWESIRKELARRGALIFVGVSSFILTFFLLLITWTEHPAVTVSGVQGRYLWGPILLLVFGFTASFYSLSNFRKTICISGIAIIIGILVLKVPDVLVKRYFIGDNSHTNESANKEFEDINYVLQSKNTSAKVEVGSFIDSIDKTGDQFILSKWDFSPKKKEIL